MNIHISKKNIIFSESLIRRPEKELFYSLTHSYTNMKRTIFSLKFTALISLCILSYGAEAANWYVRPNSSTYGTGNGSSWTNAWSGFSAISWGSVSCGDTIWVAGGKYTQNLSPAKNCTSGSPLTIARARSDASASTSAAGWSSSFDSTVEQYLSSITFGSYNYITVSGRSSAKPSDFGSYGWLINFPGVTQGKGIEWPNGSTGSYITVEYMEIRGPDILGFTNDGRGVDDTPFSTATNHTFSHVKISGWESGLYVAGTNNHVSEYMDISHIQSDGVMHPNIYYLLGTNNGIIRNSRIYHNCASGVGIGFSDGGPWDNWKIYGNTFYDNTSAFCSGIGYVLGIQDSPITGLKVFNNTFSNNDAIINPGPGCSSGCEVRNNIFHGKGGTLSLGTATNNISTSSDIFANLSKQDYHLTSTSPAINAATNIGSPYNIDMDNITRGADGSWDIGAYEYTGGGSTPSVLLAPPSNLKVMP